MVYRIAVFIACLLALTGCQYPFEFGSESEIREEVLSKDPSFKSVLKQKAELDAKIAGLKSELANKENSIKSQILGLKRQLSAEKGKTSADIRELERQFEPYRLEMKQKIMELNAELKLRESSLSATNKMVSKLRKLIEQNSAAEGMKEEISEWQAKIDSQSLIAENLQNDIAGLRKKIRLTRLKLKLIS